MLAEMGVGRVMPWVEEQAAEKIGAGLRAALDSDRNDRTDAPRSNRQFCRF